jgi:hypothetical protein
MTQHTPGPWTLKKAAVRSATGRVVARIPALNADDYYLGKRETPPQDSLALQLQREANAALISAAPALLEALRGCRESLEAALEHITKDGMTDEHEELYYLGIAASDNAKSAIATAEGGATKHVHSFSIWHDRQDRPARGYSRCACGVEPGDDWAEAK